MSQTLSFLSLLRQRNPLCFHSSGMQTHRHSAVDAAIRLFFREHFWLFIGSWGFTAVRLKFFLHLSSHFYLCSPSPPPEDETYKHLCPPPTSTFTDFNKVGKERLNVLSICREEFVVLPWWFWLLTSLTEAQTSHMAINMGGGHGRKKEGGDSFHALPRCLSVCVTNF